MTNLECALAVLVAHREARRWTDEDVAADMLAQLGVDPGGNAKNAKPVIVNGITEDEVVAHEAAATEAATKAKAARQSFVAAESADKEAKAEEDMKAAQSARDAAKQAGAKAAEPADSKARAAESGEPKTRPGPLKSSDMGR